MIVGFPYEEEEDVDNLIEFIKDIKFDRLGAFTFSLEEGTKACEYPNVISNDTKNRRYERLMAEQAKIALELNTKRLNTIIDGCFITGYDEESFMYTARSDEYAPDDIDGCIYVASIKELELGERISVKILDCDEYSLTGEAVFEN
jgi:ribosomal protein S12 methylthiotransferase